MTFITLEIKGGRFWFVKNSLQVFPMTLSGVWEYHGIIRVRYCKLPVFSFQHFIHHAQECWLFEQSQRHFVVFKREFIQLNCVYSTSSFRNLGWGGSMVTSCCVKNIKYFRMSEEPRSSVVVILMPLTYHSMQLSKLAAIFENHGARILPGLAVNSLRGRYNRLNTILYGP